MDTFICRESIKKYIGLIDTKCKGKEGSKIGRSFKCVYNILFPYFLKLSIKKRKEKDGLPCLVN